MTALLVLAVAAERKVGLVRERGEKVQQARGFWRSHLRPEFALEHPPRFGVVRVERERDEPLARRERRHPDVIEIALGEIRFGHAARRTAHGTESDAFAGRPR